MTYSPSLYKIPFNAKCSIIIFIIIYLNRNAWYGPVFNKSSKVPTYDSKVMFSFWLGQLVLRVDLYVPATSSKMWLDFPICKSCRPNIHLFGTCIQRLSNPVHSSSYSYCGQIHSLLRLKIKLDNLKSLTKSILHLTLPTHG